MASDVSRRRYHRAQLNVKVGDDRKSYAIPWLCAATIALLLGTSMTFVWLRSSTSGMQRQIERKKQEVNVNNQKIRNLHMEYEKYSAASYIENKVEELKLGLRRPVPGQVRRLPADAGGRNRADFDADGMRSGAVETENEIVTTRPAAPAVFP